MAVSTLQVDSDPGPGESESDRGPAAMTLRSDAEPGGRLTRTVTLQAASESSSPLSDGLAGRLARPGPSRSLSRVPGPPDRVTRASPSVTMSESSERQWRRQRRHSQGHGIRFTLAMAALNGPGPGPPGRAGLGRGHRDRHGHTVTQPGSDSPSGCAAAGRLGNETASHGGGHGVAAPGRQAARLPPPRSRRRRPPDSDAVPVTARQLKAPGRRQWLPSESSESDFRAPRAGPPGRTRTTPAGAARPP